MFWVGRDLRDPGWGHLSLDQGSQIPIQPGLEHLQNLKICLG